MKLETNGDGYRLIDETGATIQIEDEDELMDAYLELEKHFGASDPEVRYRELTEQLAKLQQMLGPDTESTYQAMESALRLLAGDIVNMRTELMVVKAHVCNIADHTGVELEEA